MSDVEFSEAAIDAIFAKFNQCQSPGAAVGIAVAGRSVYRKGFGLASMNSSIVLSPTTRMRIGSVTKHFTALAYMLLCERGKARLDDEIGTYLPELHSVTRRATAVQLMAHTSGVRDVSDIHWTFSGTGWRVGSEELLNLYRTIDDVNSGPGEAWSYNNGAYLLLTAAIERISGRSLQEVFREQIFEPIGMYDTMLRPFDSDFVPNSAELHMPRLGGGFERSNLATGFSGEGGLISTINDMLLWLHHMSAPVVGLPSTWKAMRTAQMLTNCTSTGYGLGLSTQDYRGLECVRHSGGVLAGSADMLKAQSAELDVAVIVNRGDVWATSLANNVVDACIGIRLDHEVNKADTGVVTGVFLSAKTGRIVQLFEKHGRQVAAIDGTDIPMVLSAEGALLPDPIYGVLKLSIVLGALTGTPNRILLNDFGTVDELRMVDPTEIAEASGVWGRYRANSIDVEAVISAAQGVSMMRTFGRHGSVEYRLTPVFERTWRATNGTPWGGLLSFRQDWNSFRFTNSRTRALIFRRVA